MKLRTSFTLMGVLSLLGAEACGDDDPPFVPTGPTGAAATTGEAATSTSTTGGGGGAGGSQLTCADYGPDAGPFGPFGDVCMLEPGDSACVECVRPACCPEAQACESDTEWQRIRRPAQ